MTENNSSSSIGDINNEVQKYYDKIKLSGKPQDNFILDDFIAIIKKIFSKISNENTSEEEVKENDIFAGLFDTTNEDISKRLKKDIEIIENDIKKIPSCFSKKEEIFLDLDFSNLSVSIITLNDFEGYLGGYYILALKSLLILWKNEINLLDESMSFHHINKSKLDIKKIYDILNEQIEKEVNTPDGKKILTEIFDYSKFLLFKLDIFTEKGDKYTNYLELIEFDNKCNEYEKYKKIEDKDIIDNLLSKILGDNFKIKLSENLIVSDDKELYLIFRYIKDIKFIDDKLKAYNQLKKILTKYLDGKTEFYQKGNIVFFINNLISLLNKSIENKDDTNKVSYKDEVCDMEDLFIDKDLSKTYFTYLKKSQLYKNLGILKDNEVDLQKSGIDIDTSISLFEENDGAYFPFISDSTLIQSKGIFSYSTFIQPTKTDYYLKIKKEQLSITEIKSEYRIKLKEKSIDDNILKNQQSIDDKFDNNNIKTIEILAVFSAIVLFVSSSIQVFQYIGDIQSVIYVVVGFGFSLILFISLIFFLVSKEKEYYKYGYVIGILFLILTVFLVISINFNNNTTLINKDYKDKIKEEILEEIKKNNSLNTKHLDLIDSQIDFLKEDNKKYKSEIEIIINNKKEK